ncbi:MAG: type II toxin-antitoxin system VapC family toxin [Promethearchaeia archaeon]
MIVGLDTNIFLNVKNKEQPFYKYSDSIIKTIDDGKIKAIVSIITIAEMCVGYHKENELNDKEEFISGLYSNPNYKIINLDYKVADKSAEIKSKTKLKLPDAIIVATALLNNATYIITNDGEFDKAEDFINIFTSQEFYERFLIK